MGTHVRPVGVGTVYVFGVVENATNEVGEKMNAYIWREQDGDHGGNNICSCLLQYLKRRGWLQKNYGELTLIADNCVGQNKNKYVVRFLMWLVEMGFFQKFVYYFW